MSTTTATVVSIYAVEKAEQRKEQCKKIISEFDPKSDVASKQEYASCVQQLHPTNQAEAVLFWQAIVLILLVSIGYRVFKQYRYNGEIDFIECFFEGSLYGGIIVVIIIAVLFVGMIFV